MIGTIEKFIELSELGYTDIGFLFPFIFLSLMGFLAFIFEKDNIMLKNTGFVMCILFIVLTFYIMHIEIIDIELNQKTVTDVNMAIENDYTIYLSTSSGYSELETFECKYRDLFKYKFEINDTKNEVVISTK